ncbi:hypothetical protein [Treponema sp.]|uniref:hypothetical protein n=1 Tax=Treponema sp. TaxID=166 RepID=UPI00298D6518|nr:hypothetical protein [Treponema sp.]MCR5613313.1 hypothetical protein [Treponema sp.]
MKKITTKIVTLFAACAVVMFASCTNPATSSAGAGSELTVAGNSGTPVSVSNCAAYTVTTVEAASAGEVGYLLQIDNDGSQNANGLSITVSDLVISIKVGSGDWETKNLGTVTLVPDQYASPAYSKSSVRTVIPGVALPANATVQVKVVSATVSNSSKASSIIFALQREGGDYKFFGESTGNWQPAFASAN